MKARIWVAVPDPTDGYFVEVLLQLKKISVQVDSSWHPSVEACEVWARSQGCTEIEHFTLPE